MKRTMIKCIFLVIFSLTITFGWQIVFENAIQAKEIAIVTLFGSGEVAFIDIKNARVMKRVKLKDRASLPIHVAVTPNQKTAIVTCDTGYICFIDIEKARCVKTLTLLSGPEQHGITLQPNSFEDVHATPDGKTALVTESNEEGQLFFLDIETMELAGDPLTMGDDPNTVIIDSSGSKAYILDRGDMHI